LHQAFAGGRFVKDENRLNNAKELNHGSQNLDQYMLEQVETNEYKQLIKVINAQLFNLLNPLATYYSEYDADNKGLQMKEIKAEPSVVESVLKIGGKEFFSIIASVNEEMYGKLTADSMVVFSTLTDLSGGAIPESVSESIGKILNVKSYLRLAYMIDGQLYGTSVIVLKEAPDHLVMKLLKTYAYFTSMTLKRILTEEALRKSEQELRTITDNMTDLIAMTDAEGRFTFLSGNHFELFGYETEELLGRYAWEILYAEDMAKMAGVFTKSISAGEGGRAEYRVIRKDGTLIWVDATGSILYDNGEVSGALLVTRNISDRKEAELTLLEQSNFINLVIDNIPDIVFYKDINGVYLGCNREFAKHVGRKKEQIIGKTDYDIYSVEEADFFRNHDQKALEQNTPRHNEEWISYPDGKKVLIDTLKTPHLGPDGKVIGILGVSRDITDRKKAEEALRKSEHELRTIADNMTDVVAMADVEGRFTYLSESNYHLSGYKPGELLGKSILDLIHEDDLSAVGAIFQEGVVKGRKDARVEYRIRHKNGGYIWVETIGSLVLGNNGQPSGALFVSRDISDRKQMEESLKESEEKFRFLVSYSYDLIWLLTANGFLTYVSPSWEAMLGYKPSYITEKAFQTFVHPEDVAPCEKYIVEVLEAKKALPGPQYRVRHADGSWQWHEAVMTPVYSDEDKFLYFVGVSRDITDRKKTEEALQESTKRYRELFEGSRDGFVIVDGMRCFMDANQAFCEMLGYSLEELKEKKDFYCITPERWHAWEHDEIWCNRLLTDGASGVYEKEYIRKDGTIFPVELTSFTVNDEQNNILYLWGIVRLTFTTAITLKHARKSLKISLC
jgi:PAS domain S-box-containing protein